MRRTFFLLLPILLAVLAAPATAKTRVVPRDFDTIQAAVDASSDGDKVVVKKGTYHENVVIQGLADFKIKMENKPVLDPQGVGTALTVIDCTRIKLRNFRIENAGEDGVRVIECVDVQLRNFRISGCGGTGIEIRGGRTFDIYRAKIEDCGDSGIYLGSSEAGQFSRRANVQKCRVERVKGFGIHIDGQLYHAVRRNRIYECGWGIFFTINAESSRADRNRVEDCTTGGITVNGLSNFTRWNRIKRTGGDAVQVLGVECWVQGNHAKKTDGRAFVVAGRSNMFRNNKAEDCGGDGLSVLGTDLIVKYTRIKRPLGRGMVVATQDTEFRHNRIHRAGTIGCFVTAGAVGNLFKKNATRKSGEAGLVDENAEGSNEYRKNSFK